MPIPCKVFEYPVLAICIAEGRSPTPEELERLLSRIEREAFPRRFDRGMKPIPESSTRIFRAAWAAATGVRRWRS